MMKVARTCGNAGRTLLVAAFSTVCALAAAGDPAQANDLPDTLKGHGGPIKAITISADGKQALTSSFDYSLILWDLTRSGDAAITHRLIGHDGAVNDAVFLNNGQRAVSVSDDGSLALWDLTSGELVERIEARNYKMLDVAVSPDGTKAAAARWDGTARLYDLERREEIARLEGHKGNVNAVVFSADGSRLYTGGYDGQILEWTVPEGERIRPVYRHGWSINSMTRVDENRLLFGALDGTVGLIGIEEADILTELAKGEHPIQSVKVSQDGGRLAYADATGEIGIFETSSGEKIAGAPVAYGPVWDFDFVPGTKQIYHVGLDDFAMRWQVQPREVARIQSEIPRRFELAESDDPGELEFRRKCSVCHTLTADDKNRAGPTLYKVFGREAGGLAGYPYSQALKESDIVWNEETIARLFDHGPDEVVPGTKMPLQRLKSAARREALIRFLKKATAPVD